MTTLRERVDEFLAQPVLAVVGVSSTKPTPANAVFQKLRETGHRVYAVNPKAQTIDGEPCYHDVGALPEKVGGVVIVTRPEVTAEVVEDCVAQGIPRVWMHRSFESFGSSVSEEAVARCRKEGVSVIPGGCPMMFCEPVDFGHKCMRWWLGRTGKLPSDHDA